MLIVKLPLFGFLVRMFGEVAAIQIFQYFQNLKEFVWGGHVG